MTKEYREQFPSMLDIRAVAGVVLAFAVSSVYEPPYVSRERPQTVVVADSGRTLIDRDLDGSVDSVRIQAPTKTTSYLDIAPTLQDQATFSRTLTEYRNSLLLR